MSHLSEMCLMESTRIAMPEPDAEPIEPMEPDSVVVPVAPVEPAEPVPVEPETLPLAPVWLPVELPVVPVLAEPVVPPVLPVVPAEAEALGEVVEPLVPVAVASGVALVLAEPVLAEPLADVLPVLPEVFDALLPVPLAPMELEAEEAASHVPFT